MRIKHSDDSFSSDDEIPLKNSANDKWDPNNSYKSLRMRKKVECEFCDRTFYNRYQSLIHNASHIIIPLLNQNVLECEFCRFCYTSDTDLKAHISQAHSSPVDLKEFQKKRVKMRNLIEYEDDNLTIPELLTDLTNNCSVALNRAISEEIIQTLEEKFQEGFDRGLDKRMMNASRNRRGHGNFDATDSYNGFVNGFSDGSSVHYEELRRPVPVRCKYCKEMFKDRYDLAVHQICHMRINHRRIYTRFSPENRTVTKTWTDTHTNSLTPTTVQCEIQVCDLCYGFLQPRSRLRYVKKGIVSEPGKRSECNMCSRKFFELILVEKIKMVYKRREKGHRKRLTNDQRLKKIRIRLKQANKALKRCLCFISPVNCI